MTKKIYCGMILFLVFLLMILNFQSSIEKASQSFSNSQYFQFSLQETGSKQQEIFSSYKGESYNGRYDSSFNDCPSLFKTTNNVTSDLSPSADMKSEPNQNNPPYVPHNPIPENGSINQPRVIYLFWLDGDPDPDDFVTFDVYFGTSNTPPKVVANQSSTSYIPGILNFSTTYYWKIISWDNNGESAIGPLWCFTTILDTTIPFTTYTLEGTVGKNDWYISDVTLVLTASDNQSGVTDTFYKINNGTWNEYNLPVSFTLDDIYSIQFYSMDNVGNVEAIKGPFFLMIDQSSPSITLTSQRNSAFEINFIADASDFPSGVNNVFFLIDGELHWNDTEPPYEWTWTGMGHHNMTAIAFDKAGNWKLNSISTSLEQIQRINSPLFPSVKQLFYRIFFDREDLLNLTLHRFHFLDVAVSS